MAPIALTVGNKKSTSINMSHFEQQRNKKLITRKEAQIQLNELEKMILVELFETKLKVLGQEHIIKAGMLKKALDSDYSFDATIMLIKARALNAQKKGCQLEENINGKKVSTALKQLLDGMEELQELIENFYNYVENDQPNAHTLQAIWSSILMLGYYTGAHDTEISMERHSLNGYKSKVSKPVEKGLSNAKKYAPMKSLINEMTIFYNNYEQGYTSRSQLAEAIYTILMEFSLTNHAKGLEALKGYDNKCPTKRTIEENLSDSFDDKKPYKRRRLNRQKLESELRRKFTHKIILRKLMG